MHFPGVLVGDADGGLRDGLMMKNNISQCWTPPAMWLMSRHLSHVDEQTKVLHLSYSLSKCI